MPLVADRELRMTISRRIRLLVLTAVFTLWMSISTTATLHASPGPEPLQSDLAAPASVDSSSDWAGTLTVLSLFALVVLGMALGIHARRQDQARLSGSSCGKEGDCLEHAPGSDKPVAQRSSSDSRSSMVGAFS